MSWKSFSSPGEDISQFAGTSINTQLSLRAIRLIFRDLEKDEKRLDVLKSRCTAFSKAVSRISFSSATLRLVIKEYLYWQPWCSWSFAYSWKSRKLLSKMGLPQSWTWRYVLIIPIFNHMANPLLSWILGLLPHRTHSWNLQHTTGGPSVPNDFQIFYDCGHPADARGICHSTCR
jgi:hypothetical protein